MSTEHGILLSEVSRYYGPAATTAPVLDSVDLAIEGPGLTVILGPSGSGKTTLLNLIGGLDTPTSGSIRVAGFDLTEASRSARAAFRRSHVSFIFQGFNLLPGLTALENVEYGAHVAGTSDYSRAAKRRLAEAGLDAKQHDFPDQLSGGEQQRVAIARALAMGNPVLLADEPTGELDSKTGRSILELLADHAQSGGIVLAVTHNRSIAQIADRVIELSSGRIRSDTTPRSGPMPASELDW